MCHHAVSRGLLRHTHICTIWTSTDATTDASIACTIECTSTQLGEEASNAELNRKNAEEALQGDREEDLGLLFEERQALLAADMLTCLPIC